MIPDDLRAAVEVLAGRPRLLVALDFDGVLAPLVDDPAQSQADPGAMVNLRALAQRPGIRVALVSGRALAGLREVSGVAPEEPITLVGSHGAELSDGVPLETAQAELLARVTARLHEIAAGRPGVHVETKPAASVLHTRLAATELAAASSAEAVDGPGGWPGVHLTLGKDVVELSVVQTTKGTALQHLRREAAAEAVLFAGDDVTDETGFAVLESGDVGVKVGTGPTLAAYRIDGPQDVPGLVQLLADCSSRGR